MAKRKARKTRADWISAARAQLIEQGIDQVRVDPLAKRMGVTTGSFYWHFKNRDELLDALVDDWANTNSRAIIEAVENASPDPRKMYDALTEVWVEEREYSPAYDSVMRDWARRSKRVAVVVRKTDDKRIAQLKKIYDACGYENEEAFVRARILYFHQLGYYTMDIKESRKTRMALVPIYRKALLGE